jgi:tagatose 1,6-diphosphate aldolase
VLLSAGATAEDFRRSLVYAYRAGASGYLCGRAIWKSAFDRFPDLAAVAATLQSVALPYLDEINALTDRSATPWHAHASFAGDISFLHAGEDFPASYAA